MNHHEMFSSNLGDFESSVAWRYHMEVFHLEILGFPETEASEDLLLAQPEAHIWNGRGDQPLRFPIGFQWLMVIIQWWQAILAASLLLSLQRSWQARQIQ